MREIDRILSIPKRPQWPRRALVQEYSAEFRRACDAPPLLSSQAAFLAAHAAARESGLNGLGDARGALGVIQCGGGKTLALALAMLREALEGKRVMLITKASLLRELKRERERWHDVYHLPRIAGVDAIGMKSTPVCEAMTYGLLSREAGMGQLITAAPEAIFLDEAHVLGAGKRRDNLWKYIRANRATAVHAVTGTLTNASVHDYAHLLAMVLRDRSPVPIRSDVLGQWASVVDRDGEPGREDLRAIAPLVRSYFDFAPIDQVHARDAMRQRLVDTPGVVVEASEFGADSSLSISVHGPTLSTPAWSALRELDQAWTLPDGTELVDHLEVYRARQTLRLGFYSRWSEHDALDEWLDARQEWHRALRQATQYAGMTRDEASRQAEAGHSGLMLPWKRWQTVDSLPGASPQREVVWVDEGETLRNTVAAWRHTVTDEHRAIIWFQSHALVDVLQSAGVPVFRSSATPPERGLSAVMMGHSVGWNAAHFNQALVLEHPHIGNAIEQLLSRHHRTGQTRDVEFAIVGGPETQSKIENAARYASQQTGLRQRALIADWA